ncbi:MAG: amidohydrolase, partial [Methanomicrobiales archaeon HGW-Methanomicrobiales-4]
APEELFQASTNGFPPGGINHSIEVGNRANFYILDISGSNLIFSHDPVTSVVKRAPSSQICATIFYV